MIRVFTLLLSAVFLSIFSISSLFAAKPIRHDAERYVLLHQYKEQWKVEDKELDKRLAEIRKKNREFRFIGSKKLDIFYPITERLVRSQIFFYPITERSLRNKQYKSMPKVSG